VRGEGLFTPPSTQGTLVFPFTGGGVNWGRAAFDSVNEILYANTSRAVHLIKLIPRAEAAGFSPPPWKGEQYVAIGAGGHSEAG
jgi:quinoprotein glucose dehydrogenase